ncbi:ion transporter [Methylothermus subterraneus]
MSVSRQKVFHLLDHRYPSVASRAVEWAILSLILLNVLAVVLESVPTYQRVWAREFAWFERISVGLFALEYFVRLWVCVEDERYRHPVWGRLRYALTPMALIDLLAFLPFYLGGPTGVGDQARVLRVLRLVRVLKLGRYFAALEVLAFVVRREFPTLLAATLMLLILIVLAASGIYLVEGEVQPEAFGSIPQAIWWAAVTLTTVGYGDVVPVTFWGKAFGIFITIVGLGMVALPAAILTSRYTHELQERRERYRLRLQEALLDGRLSEEERHALHRLSREYGLDPEEVRMELENERLRRRLRRQGVCPHCGRPLAGEEE